MRQGALSSVGSTRRRFEDGDDNVDLTWWQLGLWGLFGGFIVDGLEFYRLVRKSKGKWPKEFSTPAQVVAELIRLISAAGLAVGLGTSGQIAGPLGAISVGAAAPLVIEKLSQELPGLPGNRDENG